MAKTQDCLICGAEKGAVYHKEIPTDVKFKGLKKFVVKAPGWKCKKCNESYGGTKEDAIFCERVAEEKAKLLALKVKVNDIESLAEAASFLNVTKEAVRKAAKKSKIDFVRIGSQICPLKESVEKYKLEM